MSYKDSLRKMILIATLAATATGFFAGCAPQEEEEVSGPDLYGDGIDESSSTTSTDTSNSDDDDTITISSSAPTESEPEPTSSSEPAKSAEPTESEPEPTESEPTQSTTSEPTASQPTQSSSQPKPTQSTQSSQPKPTQSSQPKPTSSSQSQPTQSSSQPKTEQSSPTVTGTPSTQKYTPTDTTGIVMDENGFPDMGRNGNYFDKYLSMTFVDQNGDKWGFSNGIWVREGTSVTVPGHEGWSGGQNPNAH